MQQAKVQALTINSGGEKRPLEGGGVGASIGEGTWPVPAFASLLGGPG